MSMTGRTSHNDIIALEPVGMTPPDEELFALDEVEPEDKLESGKLHDVADQLLQLQIENDRLKADVQHLQGVIEYERKKLESMAECRDDWKRFAQKLCKEAQA